MELRGPFVNGATRALLGFFFVFLGNKCNKAQERAMVNLNSQGWPFSCSLLSY